MKHLIIGNGIAGLSTAEAIRRTCDQDEITIISNELDSYWRASLSKYILQEIPLSKMWIKDNSWLKRNRINFLKGALESIDTHLKTACIKTSDTFQQLSYDKLCIATGATPVIPDVPGNDLPGVTGFRGLKDADYIKSKLIQSKKLVVIGGGVLGLEVIDLAIQNKVPCTLIQRGHFLGSPIVDQMGSNILLNRITGKDGIHKHPVEVLFNTSVEKFFSENGELSGVKLDTGETIECELAIVCIGIAPDLAPFQTASIRTGSGIIVDQFQQTSQKDIFAAGDCVVYPNESGKTVPTRTWVASRIQGKTAGLNMCGKHHLLYDEGPMYNASYLADLLYAMIGDITALHNPDLFALTWTPGGSVYRKIVFHEERIVAALMLENRNGDQAIRRLMAHEVKIADIDKPKLLDPSFDPNSLAKKGVDYILY